ncbi:hypothetical protein CDL15_Pgr004426 [Punica granatum]|uniref:Auxin-responsive protein SAUR64-like n=1 Tax=Punica granatum TaxID=22663 RepID=A0A218XFJ6_PUNGR|nr:hypothetical protein CDL15_Pgr004426 [Punica granatum]
MISPKKLVMMAKKWQDRAAKGRKRISFPRIDKPSLAEKGHFVVYSTDGKRFPLPLEYINHNVFRELFRMSEEEFGLPSNGPLVMPCDSILMEYIVSLIQRGVTESLARALLNTIATSRCLSSASSCQELTSQHILIFAY